jgi:H+/Cl- antiporter ClcA
LYEAAVIDPSRPYGTAGAAVQVGLAKFLCIVLASAGKFSGGIVFPLFAASPAFVHAFSPMLNDVGFGRLVPMAVMCTMAATQSSATRTPLASALILTMTASATTELGVLLPPLLISSYLSLYVSDALSKTSYFHYGD